MPVRGKIPPGSTVRVVFSAPHDNPGASVVGSGWLGTDDRQLKASPLPPGATATHTHTHADPSSDAFRLHLDVPADGGRIEVEVHAQGALVDSGDTDTDQFWTYFVQ